MSRVIGIDPGSEVTGYGVIDTDGTRHVAVEFAGIEASPRRLTFPERLLVISRKLEEVMERVRPTVCAVEGAFYATNVKSALKLGQVRGVVLLAAARASLPVYEYSPLEIKLALVGYGHADKRQVQTMVQVLLSLDEAPHPLDASDALAVAICHAHNAIGRPEIDGPNRGTGVRHLCRPNDDSKIGNKRRRQAPITNGSKNSRACPEGRAPLSSLWK